MSVVYTNLPNATVSTNPEVLFQLMKFVNLLNKIYKLLYLRVESNEIRTKLTMTIVRQGRIEYHKTIIQIVSSRCIGSQFNTTRHE